MKKITSILLILVLLAPQGVYAKDPDLAKMDDALARGYLAASKNDIPQALDHFSKSVKYAEKAKNWKGLVDAGNAFSALGEPKRSLSPFKKALKLASSRKDWRGLVAVSYAYMSLPEELGGKKRALSALKSAYKISSSQDDWRGIAETVKAYEAMGEKRQVSKILSSSIKVVKKVRLSSAATAFASLSKKAGNMELYSRYKNMADEFSGFERECSPPPAGWQAYGESVAGPEKISPEAQAAMRASADKDIESKRKYLAESLKKDKQSSSYYITYRDYYDYPYYHNYYGYHGYWRPLSPSHVYDWANHYLSYYRLDDDDVYVYIH